MQFTLTKLFAAVVAVASVITALPIDDAAAPVVVRSPNFKVGTIWTEPNRGGRGGILNVARIPSNCRNNKPAFADAISSIEIDPGFLCTFFVNQDCTGRSIVVKNGAFVPTLQGSNFDNNISSWFCTAS